MTDLLTIDISAILRPGVFLLWRNSRVVYVGKARCLLAALANHAIRNSQHNLPSWFPLPLIHFDRIEIIPCDVERASLLLPALVELHSPIHNRKRNAAPQSQSQVITSPAPATRPFPQPLRRL